MNPGSADVHREQNVPNDAIRHGIDPARQASFSLSNRLARLAWSVVWLLLARATPRPLHRWRAMILRAFGARLGRNVHVYPSVRIWAPWNLCLGDDVGVGERAELYSMATITVGARAVISQGAHLCTGTHDYEDPLFQLYARPITVGSHAWICAEAFVGPGVSIGDGAVVGARSVASRDVPAWMVVAGNPARPVKLRIWRPEGGQA